MLPVAFKSEGKLSDQPLADARFGLANVARVNGLRSPSCRQINTPIEISTLVEPFTAKASR